MPGDYAFVRRGRSRRVMIVLAAIYLALLAALLFLDAAPWLLTLLALPTLPALFELYSNPSAGIRLGDTELDWHSGRRSGSLALAEIDHMRFDTRWDFSVRVSAILTDKKRIHLPFEAIPPHREFEAAFESRGVPVKRNHFLFF